ncbi:MAG: 4Fe-4S dicluster domain-containing protein [Deltaproteobacteria bacterium]|nr:4Fe-4S dicluster domain-containing protein [Deltaproteobacteria bacterium]
MTSPAIAPSVGKTDLSNQLVEAGLDVQACYQCGRCWAGCPVAPFFDLLPMQVVRLSSYGLEDELLGCHTIWLCASCETCTTRCPNDIDIAGLMDLLRQRALAKKIKPAERRVAAFHRSFLRSVRRWGRTYEVGMLAAYKTRSGDLFGDLGLGWKMFKKGKLHIWPRKIRGRRKVKAMFKKSKKGSKE